MRVIPFIVEAIIITSCPWAAFAAAEQAAVDTVALVAGEKITFTKLKKVNYRIQLNDGLTLAGKIVFMDADSLVLQSDNQKARTSVNWNEIKAIEEKRNSGWEAFLTVVLGLTALLTIIVVQIPYT